MTTNEQDEENTISAFLKHEDRSYEIKEYKSEATGETKYWIFNEAGEGMTVSTADLFNLIDGFFQENY